jgi:hypothetical protein
VNLQARATTTVGSDNDVFEDLLEAIYADGRAGWAEAELIAVVEAICGAGAPSVWDVLRSLEEAGWLRASYEIAWRARRWWLAAPSLSALDESGRWVVLNGSTPTAIRERFTATVASLGGSATRCPGVGPYSPAMLVAQDADIRDLSAELRWPIALRPTCPVEPAPACWAIGPDKLTSSELTWFWDWDAGRFGQRKQASGPVELARRQREKGDRRDLFTVKDSDETWTTPHRVSAIVEAYRRAGRPLLRRDGDRLIRIPTDGYLPAPIARSAAIHRLRNGGPVSDGDVWRYAYESDASVVASICRVLGKTIIRSEAAIHEPPAEQATSTAPAVAASTPPRLEPIWHRRHPRLARGAMASPTLQKTIEDCIEATRKLGPHQ